MEIIIVVACVAFVVLIGSILFLVLHRKKTLKQPTFDATNILALFDKNNIVRIDFVRSKIVIEFTNIDFFNPEELQACGVKGISVVGDTIKFYVEGTNEENNDLYLQLKQHLEG